MKALVTGASGFIGSNLALHLQSIGWDVIAVDDLFSGDRANLTGFNGRFIELDLSDLRRFESALGEIGGISAIFHQAAITDPRHGDDAETYRKNVDGFALFLHLAASSGVRKFVYASTAGIYGNGPTPMREEHPPEILTAYGKSKLKMEVMAHEWSYVAGSPRGML